MKIIGEIQITEKAVTGYICDICKTKKPRLKDMYIVAACLLDANSDGTSQTVYHCCSVKCTRDNLIEIAKELHTDKKRIDHLSIEIYDNDNDMLDKLIDKLS